MGESKSAEKGYFKLNAKTIMTDEERNVVHYDIDTYCSFVLKAHDCNQT